MIFRIVKNECLKILQLGISKEEILLILKSEHPEWFVILHEALFKSSLRAWLIPNCVE